MLDNHRAQMARFRPNALAAPTRTEIRIGDHMPFTFEFHCANCDQPVDVEISLTGQLNVHLCETCKLRLLQNLPDTEPEPDEPPATRLGEAQ